MPTGLPTNGELDDINFFFSPPGPATDSEVCSSLCLLRRDIMYCFWPGRYRQMSEDRIDPRDYDDIRTLFPGLMLMCAAIDLLAKFHAGSDTGKVGKRFKEFVRAHCIAPPVDPDLAWEFRNSLMHSFGLYGHNGSRFGVVRGGVDEVFAPRRRNAVLVNVRVLHIAFLHAVDSFHSALVRAEFGSKLRCGFRAMYEKYGRLLVTRQSEEELQALLDTGDNSIDGLWRDVLW